MMAEVGVVCSRKGCTDTFWRGVGWDSNAKPIPRNRVRKAQAFKSGTPRIKTYKKMHQEVVGWLVVGRLEVVAW